MTSESHMLIETCRRMPDLLRENPRHRSKADAVFYYHGSKDKHNIDIADGQWYDFRTLTGGRSPVGLVMDVLSVEKSEAVACLNRWGILSITPSGRLYSRSKQRSGRTTPNPRRRRNRAYTRAKPSKPAQQPSGEVYYAQKLWAQSKPIPSYDSQHPFWRWVTTGDKPAIVEPCQAVPGVIRWHWDRHMIVAKRNTFDAWRQGQHECFSVATVAIDQYGNKRLKGAKPGSDKTTYGRGADGVFIGNPESSKVALCEGIADALAIYGAFEHDGAIWANTNTIRRVLNVLGACEWLAGRETVLYTDADQTGQDAGKNVWGGIMRWSPSVKPKVVSKYPGNAKDPAAAAVYVKWREPKEGASQVTEPIEQEPFNMARTSITTRQTSPVPTYAVLWGGNVLDQNFERHVMRVNPLTQF